MNCAMGPLQFWLLRYFPLHGLCPPPESKKPLHLFFVDVEGGQATLFVTPDQHALLIDTGWNGNNGRDADRIVAVAEKAGIRKIDDVLISSLSQRSRGRIAPVGGSNSGGNGFEHGDNRESTDAPTVQVWKAYQQ